MKLAGEAPVNRTLCIGFAIRASSHRGHASLAPGKGIEPLQRSFGDRPATHRTPIIGSCHRIRTYSDEINSLVPVPMGPTGMKLERPVGIEPDLISLEG